MMSKQSIEIWQWIFLGAFCLQLLIAYIAYQVDKHRDSKREKEGVKESAPKHPDQLV